MQIRRSRTSPVRLPARLVSLVLAGVIGLASGLLPASPATADSGSPASSASSSASPGSSTGGTSGAGTGQPGSGAPRATWGIGPLPLSKTDTRSAFSIQTGPGGQYSDKVVLVNFAVLSQQLTLYIADMGNDAAGGLAFSLQGDPLRDAGAWVHLTTPSLSVQVPGRRGNVPGELVVPFTVKVPSNAPPGDHGAAVMAIGSSISKDPHGQNVRVNLDLGTRIYLRVNGDLHPKLAIDDLRVRYAQTLNPLHGGVATVSYTVRNTGNVRLGAQQAVSVTGMFGIKSKVVAPAAVQLLFPGAEQRVTVRVPGVYPSLFEKSHVTVTPQLFADQAPMPVPAAVASSSFLAVPWGLLIVLGVLILLGLLIWLWRRRAGQQPTPRHHRGRSGGPKPVTTPPTRETVSS